MSKERGASLLAEFKGLRHQVSERLREAERELVHADRQLGHLQVELGILQAPTKRWLGERQDLIDRIEAMTIAHSLAEARASQNLEAAGEDARQLSKALEQTRVELLAARKQLADRQKAHGAALEAGGQQREQLTAQLLLAQRELGALKTTERRQVEQRTILVDRVEALEQELQALRNLQRPQGVSDDLQAELRRVEQQRRTLEAQGVEVGRQLSELRAAHSQVREERAALLARVAQLEHARQAGLLPTS